MYDQFTRNWNWSSLFDEFEIVFWAFKIRINFLAYSKTLLLIFFIFLNVLLYWWLHDIKNLILSSLYLYPFFSLFIDKKQIRFSKSNCYSTKTQPNQTYYNYNTIIESNSMVTLSRKLSWKRTIQWLSYATDDKEQTIR